MQQIFIDKFIIPASSFEEFSERMNYNRQFIKKYPGLFKIKYIKALMTRETF